jgi:raffinose/stachyose/melibiose transport system substrate-binding protein
MRKMFLPVVLILVLLSLVLSACASSATPAPADTQAPAEGGAPAADEKVTLRVLVHQNPPMVEFMEAFNQKF